MSNNIEEISIEVQPIPVDLDGTNKILEQMMNCICKIVKDNGKKGTGFFCKFPFHNKNNLLYVLITNNHILDENDIKNEKIIKFIMINKEQNIEKEIEEIEEIEKEIRMDNSRKKFTIKKEDEGIDITIIEIKPKIDKIDVDIFLEIDDKILELDCKNKSIYILHYPKDKRLVSYGLINSIYEGKTISHYCNTEYGSSGGPILLLNNFKIIVMHYGCSKNINYQLNYGTFIKYAINEFNYKYKNETIKSNKLKSTNEFGNIFKKNIKSDFRMTINEKNYELDSFKK